MSKPRALPAVAGKGNAATAFSPLSVTGCRLWLDANDDSTLTAATAVSSWSDKSGNGTNFTQGTVARYPTKNPNFSNGKQALYFGGTPGTSTTQMLQNTSLNWSGAQYSILAVAKQDSVARGGYTYVMSGEYPYNACTLFVGTTPNNTYATFTGNIATWNDTNPNVPNTNIANVMALMGMTVSGSTMTPYLNGTAQTTKVGTTGTISGVGIGDVIGGNTGQVWGGHIAEILVYNSALTTTARQQLEGYLAWKWGMQTSLPIGHPYRNVAP